MRIKNLFDLKVYYALIEDEQEGSQMAVLGLVPQLGRVLVVQKSRVDQAQDGRSSFAVLPKDLERDFLHRVAPELLPAPPVAPPPAPEPADAAVPRGVPEALLRGIGEARPHPASPDDSRSER